jgi:hypothetical protein
MATSHVHPPFLFHSPRFQAEQTPGRYPSPGYLISSHLPFPPLLSPPLLPFLSSLSQPSSSNNHKAPYSTRSRRTRPSNRRCILLLSLRLLVLRTRERRARDPWWVCGSGGRSVSEVEVKGEREVGQRDVQVVRTQSARCCCCCCCWRDAPALAAGREWIETLLLLLLLLLLFT